MNDDDDRYDESFGQVDGDQDPSGGVNFTPAGAGQPWLRAGTPPWQLWGNTQPVSVPPDLFTNPNLHEQQITLLRISYKRPETWRFLFSARMLSGPGSDNHQSNVSVWFELLTGIGRSAIRIPFWVSLPQFSWNNLAGPSTAIVQWTTHATESGLQFSFDSQDPQVTWQTQILSDLIVGQDLTVVAHCSFTTNLETTTPAVVEVSGQLAPNVHTRPDWYRNAPDELVFPGAEVEGR